MSRWGQDPEGGAEALIGRSLDDIGPSGRVLLANPGGGLPAQLAARGVDAVSWNRRKTGPLPAAAWPPAGPFDLALVRLAKAKDEQHMTAHAVLSVLAPGGRFILYGGNEEGIRSAAAILQALAGPVGTLAARGHGRILAARRPQGLAGLRAGLAAWRSVAPIEIAGTRRDWVSYPGVFAAGRVDEGTALLLGVLPPLAAGARVLDYGCGTGVIGAAMMEAWRGNVVLDLHDNDAVALEAARENVGDAARIVCGTRLADMAPAAGGDTAYDAIVSNPPLHRGIAEDHALLEALIADAPRHLAEGGMLQLVVQRRVPLQRLLARGYGDVMVAAESGRYRVWRARRA